MSRLKELVGQRFGRLTVVERVADYVTPKGQRKTRWKCICDCGKEHIVTATNLQTGEVKSCGCLSDEDRRRTRHKKHGGFGTRLYRIYRGMYERCYNKNTSHYLRYGGRGIKMCSEWLGEKGFINFKEWALSNGYNDSLSIDRKDNDKGYSPDNCRWATNKEQMNNRRCNVFLEMNGQIHTMAEWARITKINVATIKSRHKAGWKDIDILTRPVDKRKATRKKIQY